jgi:ELWxxDGT repeat protein
MVDISPGAVVRCFGLRGVNGSVLFSAEDGVHGRELWRTDGTAGGTTLIKDISPGAGSSFPTSLVALGGKFYFAARDGVHGVELWQSDGSDAGTTLVADIAPGARSSSPSGLVAMGSSLYFVANDGSTGVELWKLDTLEPACPYSIRPEATGFAFPGGTGSVSVATAGGCPWTTVSNASWITVTSGANVTGSGTVSFEVSANAGENRYGTVSVAGHVVHVAQGAAGCTFSITPGSASLGPGGGVGTASVTAVGPACTWTAARDQPWITVSGAGGSGAATSPTRSRPAGRHGPGPSR